MSAAEQEMWLREGAITYGVTQDELGWLVERQGYRPGEDEPWYTLTLGVFTSEWDARECLNALAIEHTAHGHGIGRRLRDSPTGNASLTHRL